MAVDLTASYGGIKIKNPIFGSSSPVTQQPEICEKAYKAGLEPWRPIPPKKSDPVRRGKKGVMRPPYSCVLIMLSMPTSSFWLGDDYIDYYNAVKKVVGDDCLIIPSIYAASEKEWGNQCRRVEKMKARVVHVNLACPIVAGWPGLELPEELKILKPYEPPAANPEVAKKLTKFCVDRLDIPVVVKLHPFSFANVQTALAVQEVGAQGIEMADSNTGPMLRIDPETATPGWHPDYPVTGGGWGSWIIQHLCGQIFRMKKEGVKIDIAAVGGVMTTQDVLRYIMAGASSIGSARTIMVEGWGIAADWLEELEQWMEKKGYKSIEEIKGIIVDKVVTDPAKLERTVPQIIGGPRPSKEIALTEKKCIGCGWCAATCMHCAIEIADEKPVFDRNRCEVCGMCEAICPVNALAIQPRK